MIYVDTEVKEAFLSGQQKDLYLTFSDGTVITNDEIYIESLSISQSVTSEESLYYGRCSSAVFKVKTTITSRRFIDLTVDVEIRCDGQRLGLGTYKIDSDNITQDKNYRELVGYDALKEILPVDYANWHNRLEFPMTLRQYRDSFFNHIGIEQEETALVNDNMTIDKNFVADGYPGSNVLQFICEINAALGFIDFNGKFKYATISRMEDMLLPAETLYPANNLYPRDWVRSRFSSNDPNDSYLQSTLDYQEYVCKAIERVQVRHTESDIGVVIDAQSGTEDEDANTYIIENNPLLYGKDYENLSEVAHNFISLTTNVEYTPASFSTRGRPWLELGDMLCVVTRRGPIYMPILEREISGITALKDTYKAKGTYEYSEKANSKNYNIQVLKQFTNEFERTAEATISRLTEINTTLDGVREEFISEIKQTARDITSTVTAHTATIGAMAWNKADWNITQEGAGEPNIWNETGEHFTFYDEIADPSTSRYPIHSEDYRYLDIKTGTVYEPLLVESTNTYVWSKWGEQKVDYFNTTPTNVEKGSSSLNESTGDIFYRYKRIDKDRDTDDLWSTFTDSGNKFIITFSGEGKPYSVGNQTIDVAWRNTDDIYLDTLSGELWFVSNDETRWEYEPIIPNWCWVKGKKTETEKTILDKKDTINSVDDIYLDTVTGYLWFPGHEHYERYGVKTFTIYVWSRLKNGQSYALEAMTETLYNDYTSKIEQTAYSITSTVAAAEVIWYEDGVDITYYGYGNPTAENTAESPANYAMYLDQSTGMVWRYNSSTRRWTTYKQLTSIQSNTESKIEQTASGILSTVSSNYETKGDASSKYRNLESQIDQKPDSITLSVTGSTLSSTQSASIKLYVDGQEKSSGTIKLSGDVIFASELKDGTTTISGDNIKTGTISASRIDVDNLTAKKLHSEGTISGVAGTLYTDITAGYIKFGRKEYSGYSNIYGYGGSVYIETGSSTAASFNSAATYIHSTIYLQDTVYSKGIYNDTVSSDANIFIGSAYKLRRKSSSSRRYKHDIVDIGTSTKKRSVSELDPHKLYNLRVVQFKYNEDYLSEDDGRYLKDVPGFIAEEVEEAYPIAVDRNEDGTVEDWSAKFIVPPMLKLIQEQHEEIEALKAKNEELETRLAKVEALLAKL